MEHPKAETRAVTLCQVCTRPLGGLCVATKDSRVICQMCHEFLVQTIQRITDSDQALEDMKRELAKSYPKDGGQGHKTKKGKS